MSSIVFPLQHCKYSSEISENAIDALSKIFKSSIDRENLELSVAMNGHNVQIGNKKLWFKPGSKTVIVQENDQQERSIDGKTALQVRQALKELHDHAIVLNVVEGERFPSVIPTKKLMATPFGEAVKKKVCIASLVAFILLKGIDLSHTAANYFADAATLSIFVQIIGRCSASFKLVQGSLSLLFGTIELIQGIRLYRQAKAAHDAQGVTIAKQRIVYGIICLCECILWTTLGIIFLACPQAAATVGAINIACTVVQYIFQTVSFADSATSLALAVKTLKSIERYRLRFEMGILKNQQLTLEEKQIASRRFLQRLMHVTAAEKCKIAEKCHNLPSKIRQRLQEKVTKKRIIAARLGLTDDLLRETTDRDLFEKVKKCYQKQIRSQTFSKYLYVICSIANFLGFPVTAIDFSKLV